MIKSIKHIHKIFNNPFLFTPLFVNFYKNYSGQNKDILLSYLILPLVLHNETRIWLQNARSNSSLTSFGRNRENYYGLPERVDIPETSCHIFRVYPASDSGNMLPCIPGLSCHRG
jgi:hypothetical protein